MPADKDYMFFLSYVGSNVNSHVCAERKVDGGLGSKEEVSSNGKG